MSTTPAPRVLLACDKFKGSLTSTEVVAALRAGITSYCPGAVIEAVPVADGGDGTLDAARAAGFAPVPVTVTGPTGQPVSTAYLSRDDTVVVEMADACGLLRLPGGTLDPLGASSRGLGEVIRQALDAGPRRLVVGVGGSASTDGGAGMLAALGAALLDEHGRQVPDGGGHLASIARVDLAGLDPRLRRTEVVLASDVSNPLCGPQGAAAIFAPQKGADPGQVDLLEAGLAHFAALVTAATGRDDSTLPGAGAAGGVGYAALAVLDATMRPGIELVLELAGFDSLLPGADLVVTGEGSLDLQTLLGKTPAGVAAAAARAGVPVVAVCGQSLLAGDELGGTGIARVYQLVDLEADPTVCMRDAGDLLARVAEQVAGDWLG